MARSRIFGYTIIELLIAISILGIIVSLAVLNLSVARARARDANRKDSVGGYHSAMEQYRTSRGTYFVYSVAEGGCNPANLHCSTLAGNVAPLAPVTESTKKLQGENLVDVSYSFFSCVNGPGCAGYKGAGWGRMTRRHTDSNLTDYNALSIADALQRDGFLDSVRTDPRTSAFTDAPATVSYADLNDYYLTLCDKNGLPPSRPSLATEFAIFAMLELENPVEVSDARRQCAAPETGDPIAPLR